MIVTMTTELRRYFCMYVYKCVYVCVRSCTYACMCARMHVCMRACMHVCMHVRMHECIHMYRHVSTDIHPSRERTETQQTTKLGRLWVNERQNFA